LWGLIFDSQPVSVSAQGLRLAAHRPEIDHIAEVAIDTATLVIRFESGDIGTFVVSWGLPPGVNPPNPCDQIYGPRGLGEVHYAMKRQELRFLSEGADWQSLSVSEEDMYQREIERFARWVLAGEPFPAIGEDGKAALRVALAALESIKTGETITLQVKQ
jgi:myo-inositol 2-dehydrogenase/D-chiro-inositol 1-dehydrogenase